MSKMIVIRMRPALTLMDPIAVHVSLDIQEMENTAPVILSTQFYSL